ncbi:anaerobic ribonucleoside-triphosphate reductase [Peptoniphilus sp. oral taxon 836 str. F0141]|nr:anaerobic ribonucleoside-triphosphate reductase [Peptoniphilus sp. oral taxon 836 str. F0141]
MLTVIKRNGTEVPFDKEKITIAIEKAMNSTTGVFVEDQAEKNRKRN